MPAIMEVREQEGSCVELEERFAELVAPFSEEGE
jgi:hypothetical protein